MTKLERRIKELTDRSDFALPGTDPSVRELIAAMQIALDDPDPLLSAAALSRAQEILLRAIPNDSRSIEERLSDKACAKHLEWYSIGCSDMRRSDHRRSFQL